MNAPRLAGAAALAFALLAAGAATASANELGVAVIVGNKEYADDRVPEVSYAHNDAEAFKRFVTDTLGFDSDNVIDLRDATKSQLETAFGVKGNAEGLLWRYIDPSGGSDVVVFYSGHGVPGKAGRGYLLPADSNPDTAELNGYPIDLLYENLGGLATRSTTVFLDACFSGGSPRGMLIQSASPVYVEADISGGAGLTVLTAASGAQLASWDEEARHGLFTEHLLNGLYGAADADGDGQVTAREAKLHLDRTMTRAARREFGRLQDAGLHGDESAVLSFSAPGGWGSRPLLGPPPAAFTVLVEPAGARVRILNIGRPYRAGMELAAGSYQVEASAPGYVTKTETVAHGSSATVHRIVLSRPGQPFTIDPAPAHAQVRLLDHGEAYQRGMLLPPGSYRVEASAEGYETATETVAHGTSPTVRRVALRKAGPKAGDRFRDCPECPEMVVVPAGSFLMGSPESEQERDEDEGPVHRVRIAAPFALGVYEVTFAEWDACEEDGGCGGHSPDDRGWGRERRPVINVSWEDVQAYVGWLSEKTGKRYRLPSESEWEYAARAGTRTPFHTGTTISTEQANYDGEYVYGAYGAGRKGVYRRRTVLVGSFGANAWGLHDMHGNVWEWTEDCWNGGYAGAPTDGSAWESGVCSMRVLRGGSWLNGPSDLRAAGRVRYSSGDRNFNVYGFRVARTLTP